MSENARHMSKSAEHYTPAYIVSAAYEVMGYFDLDPASCEEANQLIRAERIYTKADSGHLQPWFGRVFLNPPGTCGLTECGNRKVCSCKLVAKFWATLWAEYMTGRVEAAIWIGFSLEQLQNLQNMACPSPLVFPICYPKRRVAYCGNSPPHGSYIALLPDRNDPGMVARFERAFSPIGHVVTNQQAGQVPLFT